MSGSGAFIWFVTTTVLFAGLMVLGTYLAVHSYERGRGVIHFPHPHLRHRHR
jgi:hypothetical protein